MIIVISFKQIYNISVIFPAQGTTVLPTIRRTIQQALKQFFNKTI